MDGSTSRDPHVEADEMCTGLAEARLAWRMPPDNGGNGGTYSEGWRPAMADGKAVACDW